MRLLKPNHSACTGCPTVPDNSCESTVTTDDFRPSHAAPDNTPPLPHLPPRLSQGSDPGAATCRGKLQYRRSRLNVDINKHLLLRQGAENLFRSDGSEGFIDVEFTGNVDNDGRLHEKFVLHGKIDVHRNVLVAVWHVGVMVVWN